MPTSTVPATGRCHFCGAELAYAGQGQRPRYCRRPAACRQRAFERRHGIKPGRTRRRR